MKILQVCDNVFPAKGNMGAERVVERTCRGLQKLGHQVWLKARPESKLDWIEVVQDIPEDCEIIHHHGWCWDKEGEYKSWGKPWVSTIHGGGMETDPNWLKAAKNNPHIICVSRFVADRIGNTAFVHACSNPDEFIYDQQKDNYFLYIASLDWGIQKGLDDFIYLSRKMLKYDFVVAGGTTNPNMINQLNHIASNQKNFKFVGEVNGDVKAKWLSKAKALILPTKLPDACPTTISESLMSGTPVIGSVNGALPELLTPDVGFLCKTEVDYVKAILNVAKIKPERCREVALEKYSDTSTAQKYLTYYQNMLQYGRV